MRTPVPLPASLLLLLCGAPALLSQAPKPLAGAAESITEQDVIRHIGVIADDSMLGRDTPSRGLDLTAQYIADQFKQLGLTPGGMDGTWFQRYRIPPQLATTAPNVIGVLESSDSSLRRQYVVFLAHMDHT